MASMKLPLANDKRKYHSNIPQSGDYETLYEYYKAMQKYIDYRERNNTAVENCRKRKRMMVSNNQITLVVNADDIRFPPINAFDSTLFLFDDKHNTVIASDTSDTSYNI